MKRAFWPLILTLVAVAIALNLMIGNAGFDLTSEGSQFAIVNVRLPRVLIGLSVAVASAFGTVLLGLALRTDIAEPALFGINSFAALGSIVAMLGGFGFASVGAWLLAAACVTLALLPLSLVDRHRAKNQLRHSSLGRTELALVGIAVGAFATALVGLAASASPDPRLRSLSTWAFGTLALVDLDKAQMIFGLTLLLATAALVLSKSLAPLALGRSWMLGLGDSFTAKAALALGLVGLLSASSAFATGSVGFVGLLGAILGSRLTNGSLRQRLLAAAGISSALVLFADLAARTIAPPFELPIGVFTSLIGAPALAWVLIKGARRA